MSKTFFKGKKIYHTQRPVGLNNIFIAINKEINNEIKKGRPVLVIMDNIRNVDDFVSQSSFRNINTIKEIKPDEDEKIARRDWKRKKNYNSNFSRRKRSRYKIIKRIIKITCNNSIFNVKSKSFRTSSRKIWKTRSTINSKYLFF